MLDQRLREGTEAVKAALADTVPPAEELFLVESSAARDKVGWRGPLIAVATAVAILVVVGITALVLRSNNLAVTDEPAPPTTVTSTPVSTTVTTTPGFIGDPVTSWQVTEVVEPWVHSIVDTASLPGGGFVVAVDHSEASVLWSRDGRDWVEADPQGQVAVAAIPDDWFDQQPQAMTVSGDRVFILDETNLQVWVGDLAAEAWEPVRLDAAGLTGSIEAAAIASNDHEVLVVAKWTPTGDPSELPFDQTDYVVWLVDPATDGVERHTLPLDSVMDFARYSYVTDLGLAAVWFQDHWVIAMGDVTAVSRDGTTWTVGWDPDGLAEEGSFVTALVVGPDGLITTTCGGLGPHFTFYSEDGLEWTRVPEYEQFAEQAQGGHGGAAYSHDLGFVMVFPGDDVNLGRMEYSKNGRNWSSIDDVGLGDNHDVANLAASGRAIFVDHRLGASLLTPSG